MVIKLGNVSFQITLANPNEDLMSMTVSEALARLDGASIAAFLAPSASGLSHQNIPELITTQQFIKPLLTSNSSPDPIQYISLLKEASFTGHTIVMVLKKVLNIRMKQETLIQTFPIFYPAVMNWLEKDLSKEKVWAIYIAPISIPRLGQIFVAVGINKENQFIILSVSKSHKDLYASLHTRKLDTNAIKFGILSLYAGTPAEFKKVFPKVVIGRDWKEVSEMQEDEDIKDDINMAMMSPDMASAKRIVRKYKLPEELLNYYKFDPDFWRVFRTATAMPKLERELRSSTRMKQIKTDDELKFITAFTLLRIQYYWIKTPVNSEDLLHLKSVKLKVEHLDK